MSPLKTVRVFCSLCGLLFVAASALAGTPKLETWADSDLPVKSGLQLWLDATRENAARKTRDLPTLAPQGKVDIWHDGSGHGRHVSQRVQDHRPVFFADGSHRIAFDGGNDFLSGLNWGQRYTNLTLVIVVSPQSNGGGFRALAALNKAGQNDFTSGLTLDFGPFGSKAFEFLNPEGIGFTGAQNVLLTPFEFGRPHVVVLTVGAGDRGVQAFINGKPQGSRRRGSEVLHMDEFTVGARCYSVGGDAPSIQGYLDGEISQVLLYDRVLPESERSELESFLHVKSTPAQISGRKVVPLKSVLNPPPVHFLVPGFTTKELPVALNNINNLRYREDGKLVAVGYDGQIFLLSDTDGDGLEDKSTPFWTGTSLRAPIGMALTPPGYKLGTGVFVAAKSKVVLIVDTNRDDKADQEIIVASGWNELSHGVDALGVAVDHEGAVYFGLGVANFTDGYLMDRVANKARVDMKSERGTIIRVAPDFKSREIVCTGIRFPVAMSFNRERDLFCTDQEGATWLPNGNPLDELLHITTGRHYGFPPRHPKHLPNVIDEPSVFDYTPQHQSTCGLTFNEPVNGGPSFGPASWRGDALVTGYSRGKIYRTQLVKTEWGYVARNHLIGSLPMLPIDSAVTPRGALVIAAHSGLPDWGSGPNGAGKLYQVRYGNGSVPQPVAAWVAGPGEVRIAYDRPLPAAELMNWKPRVGLTQGRFVYPGDSYETLRPGYQTVKDQLMEPRYELELLGVSVTPDSRTVVLSTRPHNEPLNLSVRLPSPSALGHESELLVELHGLEATLDERARFWLPHLDLSVAKAFTKGSAEHERFFDALKKAASLTLRTKMDLSQMLRPVVQPGSQLDYPLTKEEVTVSFRANRPFTLSGPSGTKVATGAQGRYGASFKVVAGERDWSDVSLRFDQPSEKLSLQASWHTAEDTRARAFPLRRFYLPWASPKAETKLSSGARSVPELVGGRWTHGRSLFFGKAACATCHTFQGEGGQVGPDLSNLIHRDYGSVLRDIVEPNATINPDHVAHQLEFSDGELVVGLLGKVEAEALHLTDAQGITKRYPKSQIVASRPASLSLMPEGYGESLTQEEMKDLLTFLLTPGVEPGAGKK